MALTDLSHLKPGDVLTLASSPRKRIVVRLIDATGELGGLVDTKALDGRYSRSAGFVAGRDIETVEPVGRANALWAAEHGVNCVECGHVVGEVPGCACCAAIGWPR